MPQGNQKVGSSPTTVHERGGCLAGKRRMAHDDPGKLTESAAVARPHQPPTISPSEPAWWVGYAGQRGGERIMSCFDLFGSSLFSVHNTPIWGEGWLEFVEGESYVALAHFKDGEIPIFDGGVASIPVTNNTGLWGWGNFSCKEDDLPPSLRAKLNLYRAGYAHAPDPELWNGTYCLAPPQGQPHWLLDWVL